MTNGGFIGIFSCCGEHILSESKAISLEKALIHNQVNSGCKLKEHVSMPEEDATMSAVKKKIGFQHLQERLKMICHRVGGSDRQNINE
jgi:hypothetical protein